MGNTNSPGFEERISEKHPEFRSYKECQSKTFSYGLGTFITSVAITAFGQEFGRWVMRVKLTPANSKVFLLAPLGVGSVTSYYYTRQHTRKCQEMWLAAEEKHSELNPIQNNDVEQTGGLS